MGVLLTRRAVLRAQLEPNYNDPQAMDQFDGVLVSEPVFTAETNVLERDFTRDSISRSPHIIGRKTAQMTFTTELRGNGRQNSGLAADAPIIARLFQACGYELVEKTAPHAKGPFDIDDHPNTVLWTADVTDADNTDTICYFLEVTTGGVSGVAEITVTSETAGESNAAAVVTTATEFAVGASGLTVTPTFTGTLVEGQKWVIWLFPTSSILQPVSDDFQSITLEMNKDGVRHFMPGAFGTFEITATAGEYATVSWTFMGLYVAPTDAVAPAVIYERTLPPMVELARLRVDGFYAIVETLSFNQSNDVQIRPDVSSAEGIIGYRIVNRAPEGGINPEATLVADNDFWGDMTEARRMPLQMRVGQQPGNTVWMVAPGVQYTGLTYADRNGILTYDAGLMFPAYLNNDEIFFVFA